MRRRLVVLATVVVLVLGSAGATHAQGRSAGASNCEAGFEGQDTAKDKLLDLAVQTQNFGTLKASVMVIENQFRCLDDGSET